MQCKLAEYIDVAATDPTLPDRLALRTEAIGLLEAAIARYIDDGDAPEDLAQARYWLGWHLAAAGDLGDGAEQLTHYRRAAEAVQLYLDSPVKITKEDRESAQELLETIQRDIRKHESGNP